MLQLPKKELTVTAVWIDLSLIYLMGIFCSKCNGNTVNCQYCR